MTGRDRGEPPVLTARRSTRAPPNRTPQLDTRSPRGLVVTGPCLRQRFFTGELAQAFEDASRVVAGRDRGDCRCSRRVAALGLTERLLADPARAVPRARPVNRCSGIHKHLGNSPALGALRHAAWRPAQRLSVAGNGRPQGTARAAGSASKPYTGRCHRFLRRLSVLRRGVSASGPLEPGRLGEPTTAPPARRGRV